jgi:cytochrome P450
MSQPEAPAVRAGAPRADVSRRIPEAGRIEFLLDLPRMRSNPLSVWERMYERYGPVVLQQAASFKAVHLFGPEANRFLMLDREELFSARRSWDLIMGRIFSNGLLLKDGADHRHHRKIMHQAFKTPVLKGYSAQMNPLVARGLDAWRSKADGFLAFPALKELTLDLAASIFLGIELGPRAKELNRAFEDTVAASMSLLRFRIPGLEFYRGLRGREFMIGFFGGLIAERRAGDGRDMLSQLCRAESEDGEKFSDTEIVDHMIFLMMAAHDTTTSTLTSMIYELARHPDWQERVRAECLAIRSEQLAYEDLERLEDTRLVLNETLRRYPPLSTIPRMSLREFEFGGYRLPGDALVSCYPLHTHHMREWWAEPYRFDPERFSKARAEHEQHTHLFVPFSGGEHMCLGKRFAEMQIRQILFQLVRRFRWSVADGYTMPVQQAPISKPMDGLPLRLEAI